VFRTIGDQVSVWESLLPEEVLRLPAELARVDALLDDPAFFAPFARYFDPLIGRPSTPVECYLRLMFLKFRYRLGFESLCAEVSDSITWRRFCRIPIDGRVPHPTTLMKLTSRCGEEAVAGLNEALWAKASAAKLLRTARVRADTTVVGANVAYPTDSGLLAKAVGKLARTVRRVQAAGGATATKAVDRRRAAAGAGDRQQAAHPRQAGPGGEHPGDRPGDRRARRTGAQGSSRGRRGVAQRPPGTAQGPQRPGARQAAPGAG
jgi:IS5 family transposase